MAELTTEVVVIGAGPGGYVAAIRLAQLGKKVALVENDKYGGICLNYGCIPSKAMIHAAEFLDKVKHAESIGIIAPEAMLDFTKMQAWKHGITEKLNNGVKFLCTKNNITLVEGTAQFESSTTLKVSGKEDTTVAFEQAIVATGSKPVEIPNFKFDGKTIINSRHALALENVPKSLAVIGAGYIGLELGTVYAKLGSKVSFVEMFDQILPRSESLVAGIIENKLKTHDVSFYTGAKAEKCENGKVTISLKDGSKQELEAEVCLVAVGRYPNTKELGLEKTKAKLDTKGFVEVNDQLQSADEHIYAIGDVSVGPMLAHKASYQGKFVAEVIAGDKKKYGDVIVPEVIFTDPEIANVGITEHDAKEKDVDYKTGKFPFKVLGRAMTKQELEGFVKLIADAKTEKVLGAEIIGSNASDLISEVALAIRMGSTLEDLSLTIHPHPSLSESIMEAAEATMGKAIHILNPK